MTEENRSAELMLLGEIKGLVQGLKDGQDVQTKRLDAMDTKLSGMDARLRDVERKSALFGAVSGGAMSVGVALIIEGLKGWAARGGSH
ncbi:MAG: hypothetical protein E6Q67_12985 [Roseateles sp.]|nr:MAG: hypothetical protein E6Q67_12985 [Roseateles sp.]